MVGVVGPRLGGRTHGGGGNNFWGNRINGEKDGGNITELRQEK